MKKSIANKKVSEMTVGQLFKIIMSEVEPMLDTREEIMMLLVPEVVWAAEAKQKPNPNPVVVRKLLDDFFKPLIAEEQAKQNA